MFLNEYAVVSGKTNVSICIYGQNYVESGRMMAGDGKCAKNIWREMWSAPKRLYRSWCQHDVLAMNQRKNDAMTDILDRTRCVEIGYFYVGIELRIIVVQSTRSGSK